MPDSATEPAPSAPPGQNGLDSGAPHAQAADGFRRQLAGVVECSDDTRPSLACFVHAWLAPHPTAPGTDESADDDDSADNLTRRLAETAVGVRAMSKLLGRARIRTSIQSVLVVTKARDNRLIGLTRQLALYLMLRKRESESGRGLVVYVDAQLRHSKRFDAAGIARDHPELFRPVLPRRRTSSNLPASAAAQGNSSTAFESGRNGQSPGSNEGQLRYWTREMCTGSPHLFDVVVTLGGDGTVLFASWLFQRIVPPVLPFGSPGFLATFNFGEHRAVLETAIETGIRVNLRMRFTCTVYRGKRKGKVKKGLGDAGAMLRRALEKGGWEALEGGDDGLGTDTEIGPYATRPEESFEVLNDVVVDRGLSSYISLLELFGDEHHMTTAQADGLCIATPTGSTAYSLAAGGSLVNPEIPAMLITPICPHTLSFRPILLPDTMELRICVPYNSRSSAWASFDGRGRIELKQGDHLKVTASKYPFPTVCSDKPSTDWFRAISRTLRWNERERQKSFVVVEEDSVPSSKRESGDGTEEEEEEETFDIDDLPAAGQDVTSSYTSTPSEPSVDSAAADSLAQGGIALGSDSPDRFHSRIPHPLRLPLHHARYTGQEDEHTHVVVADERRGDRDDIHRRRDGDVDAASMRTPRADTAPERSRDTAFTVENASHSVVS